MAKRKDRERRQQPQVDSDSPASTAPESGTMPVAAGPGYSGFGGSAGYSGNGVGGISGGYAGAGYPGLSWTPPPETRHDDRIHDDVCDRLSLSEEVDATGIEVEVQAGSVTLTGNVENRHMKQLAGDIAEAVPGVSSVHNRLHVEHGLLDELKEKLTEQPPSRAR
jgi:hypothetical protein